MVVSIDFLWVNKEGFTKRSVTGTSLAVFKLELSNRAAIYRTFIENRFRDLCGIQIAVSAIFSKGNVCTNIILIGVLA